MASAEHPNDKQGPPPAYGFKNEATDPSLYQCPPPAYPSNSNFPSTPISISGTQFFGHNPSPIQCPRCHQQVITIVQYEVGTGTWLIAGAIFIFGGALGCFLIPFCLPACQDALHTCPACRNFIARHDII